MTPDNMTLAVSYTHLDVYKRQILVEATAFKDGIVIVQVNEIVGKGALPRVDIPGDWVDIIVRSDEPYQMRCV